MAPKDLEAIELTVSLVDRFTSSGGEAASEVVAFDNGQYFVTNGAENRIDVFAPGGDLVASVDLTTLPNYGGVNSVAAKGGYLAVAVEGAEVAGVPQRGGVAIYDAATLTLVNFVTAGFLPDMVRFSPDGAEIYVANEGEPADGGDPRGSVSIITFPNGFDSLATVAEVDFTAFDGQEDALRDMGVRIFPGRSAAQDLEPEYIAVDPLTGDLLVTLQEANTVARIDRATLEVTLLPQGTVNHDALGNGIDASDRDDVINIVNWKVNGLRMADAIAAFTVDGETYYATANEGDDRGENERVKDLDLDPTAFPLADVLQADENLGRLNVSSIDGDVDGDGDLDELFSYGSRSFTIYDADGNVVFDSGDAFERLIADLAPERFNSEDGTADDFDGRSDNKGPEPEAIAVGEVGGRMIAVIGLERDSGVVVYDVTDPANAHYLAYIDGAAAGDIGPEVIAFIDAEDSPTGEAQIAISYEISGTTTVYDLAFVEPAFTLELLHFSDQEANVAAIGDAPRLSAVLNALRAQDLGNDGIEDNTLVLSSGDAFIPGLFLNASLDIYGQRGVADILIQNELGVEAISFGNHEFDLGTALVRALINGTASNADLNGDGADDFTGTAFPYLSGNLDFSKDAQLAGLVVPDGEAPLANTITGSTFFVKGGEKIGVVAATTPTLARISSPGTVGISPSPFDSAPTPEQLDALAAEIQADVDALLAKHPDMNKVILLSHMQQIAIEQALAVRLKHVDIIVAGGSNTRLFDEDDRVRPGDTKQGDYPGFFTGADGRPVAVVNTDGNYKYVGRLVIDFDKDGVLIPGSYESPVSGAYATDAQGVADLGAEALVDPEIAEIAALVQEAIEARESNVFGVSSVFLNGFRTGVDTPENLDGVRSQETNLGNLTADANLAYANEIAAVAGDEPVVLSLKNGGGIRASIGQVLVPTGGTGAAERLPNEEIPGVKPAGGISENDIAGALSFNNGLTLLTLTKAEIVALLEHGVGLVGAGAFPQISGVVLSFDPDNAAGSRIVNAGIFDDDGALIAELVRDGEIVGDAGQTFRIVTLNFLANPTFDSAGNFVSGGDGYPFPNTNTNPALGALGDPAVIARVNRVDLAEADLSTASGDATFAVDGSEQDALAEYLLDNFFETPYAEADTDRTEDARIQNLNFRDDAVFEDDGITAIYEIQGAGHVSAFVGQTVTTEGVVTQVVSNGFYMQDATGDGDIATSDAIFVFTGTSGAKPALGDALEITGTVSEFTPGGAATRNLSITQLGGATFTVTASGVALPAATILGAAGRTPPTGTIDDDAFASFDPETDGIDFFESLEGMLVTVNDPLAVSGTNRFGEVYTLVDGGAGAEGLSDRGALAIGPSDFNPERVQLQFGGANPAPAVNTGALLSDATGVVSYAFGNYEVLVSAPVTVADAGDLAPTTTTLAGAADRLTIASYNVLNLDPNDGDSSSDRDIAFGRFAAIAAQIVENLGAPDIVALQEIQDDNGTVNNGTTSAALTLQTLVDAIAAAGGPAYAFLDTPDLANNAGGGAPGGNIRNAYLYRADRVDFVEGSLRTFGSQAEGEAFFETRLPLVAKFAFNGETVTVVNNHFSSKTGSAPLFGVEQNAEDRQNDPAVNADVDNRLAQAEAVKAFVDALTAVDPEAKVVVLGDLNEFDFISPVETLKESLVDLGGQLDQEERSTFVFDGNAQQIDHILVSRALADGAAFEIVRTNVEFAETAERASDHDPIIASLAIGSDAGRTVTLVAGATALPDRDVSVEVVINGQSFGNVTFEKAVAITAPTRADFKTAALDETFVFETDFDEIETVEVIYSRDAWTGRGGFDQNVFVRSVDVDGSVFSADEFAFYDRLGADRQDGPGGDMYWRGTVLFDGLSDAIA